MAGKPIFNKGKALLEQTFRVKAGVTTYLDGAARAGLAPFRMVILDPVQTAGNVGDASWPDIAYPNTTHANGEKVVGVIVGPEDTKPNGVYDATYQPIKPGYLANVRLLGIAPVQTDTTTSATPILPGDFVAASQTANQGGLAKKGALTGNAPATGQHILGRALAGTNINNGVVMVMIAPQES